MCPFQIFLQVLIGVPGLTKYQWAPKNPLEQIKIQLNIVIPISIHKNQLEPKRTNKRNLHDYL